MQQYDLPFKHFNKKIYDKRFIQTRLAVSGGILMPNFSYALDGWYAKNSPPYSAERPVTRLGFLPFSKFPRETSRHWSVIKKVFSPCLYHLLTMKTGTMKVKELQKNQMFLLPPSWDSLYVANISAPLWMYTSKCSGR